MDIGSGYSADMSRCVRLLVLCLCSVSLSEARLLACWASIVPVGGARRPWVPENFMLGDKTRWQIIRSESAIIGIVRSKTEYDQGQKP